MGFLERLAEIVGLKPKPAVQGCPKEKGIICVVVSRQDKTNAGIQGVEVSLSGPTPGQEVTDETGIAEFQDREPGAYQFGVSFPSPKYKDWTIVEHSVDLSVGPGQVTIVDVFAFPTGTLVVEIRDDEGKLIADPADVATAGASSLSFRANRGTHTSSGIACGDYTVSAQLAAGAYERSWVEAPGKVTVPEGGTAKAVITVVPMTWVRVRVHDQEARSDVSRVSVRLKPAGGAVLEGKQEAPGLYAFSVSRKAKSCDIEELSAEDDVIYEVVEVKST